MVASGLSMVAGTRMAARACGSPVLAAKLEPVHAAIDRGEPLTESLARTGAFGPTTLALAGSGEVSGDLDGMLRKASAVLEDESRTRVRMLSIFLPLAAYLAVGIFVAYRVISFHADFYGSMAR